MKLKALFAAAGISALSATASFAATVGYTVSVSNAEFTLVQAPSIFAVNDADGYIISVAMQPDMALLPGATLDLSAFNVSQFTLSDIDPALMIDPDDALAFPLGISLQNIVPGAVPTFTVEAITMPAVPLPAGGVLLVTALGGIAVLRRRGRRSA